MSKVLELNKQNFASEVLQSEAPVLVDFWAPWCVPCQMMAPILDELATEMGGTVKVAKLNTEEGDNTEIAMQYQIQSIPNMKLFKNGNIIGEFIGLRNKETLKGEVESFLK